jgi:hypothetical protein
MILLVVSFTKLLYSQNYLSLTNGYYIDGLRASENLYTSTARTTSMGGAFTSLGGDLGGISVNPAGIGVFRSSEISFSPGFSSVSTSSNYWDTKSNGINYNYNLGNFGAVFTFNNNNDGGWANLNIAVGENKLNNFNYNYSIEGTPNNNSSMANVFIANSYNPDGSAISPAHLDPSSMLAFDAYVTDTANGKYISPYSNVNSKQEQLISMSGSMNEYYFGIGGNYNHKLYIGATLNLRSGAYSEEYDHTETLPNLNYFRFTQTLNTFTSGFNFKIGAIYKPFDMLRLGLSIQTPTRMYTTQTQYSNITAVENNANPSYFSPTYRESYFISTPFRTNAGIAVIFQQYGLLSFDYEYVDYRNINLSNNSNGYVFTPDNDAINKGLRATNNIRAGGELRLGSVFVRGGYAYYASPYASSEDNKDANTNIYSTGIGFRKDNFVLDLSYSYLTRNQKYSMYPGASLASLSNNTSNFMATFGFKF